MADRRANRACLDEASQSLDRSRRRRRPGDGPRPEPLCEGLIVAGARFGRPMRFRLVEPLGDQTRRDLAATQQVELDQPQGLDQPDQHDRHQNQAAQPLKGSPVWGIHEHRSRCQRIRLQGLPRRGFLLPASTRAAMEVALAALFQYGRDRKKNFKVTRPL